MSIQNGRFWFPARPERVFNRPEKITGSPTGIGVLFRELKTIENAAGGRKMPFMDGHYPLG
jgi:hypothetical protein